MYQSDFLSALAEQGEIAPGYPDGYFPHWEHNVYGGAMPERFLRMFLAGSGSELLCKACAKHSSSMLAYNFFHWVSEKASLTLFGTKFVDVAFEVQLPCLATRSAKANLDIALCGESGDFVLFLESKFTEFLPSDKRKFNPFRIRREYKNPNSYFPVGAGVCNGQQWKEVIERYEVEGRDNKHFHEGIKQGICHLIAIDRLRNDSATVTHLNESKTFTIPLKEGCKFAFATVIFEPSIRFVEDHKAFDDYAKLFATFVANVKTWNTFFSDPKSERPGILTYGDIWTQSEGSMPRELRTWLDGRYMQFSASAGAIPDPNQL